MAKKKSKSNNLVLLVVAAMFVVTAVAFCFTQLSVKGLLKEYPYNGFKLSFNKDEGGTFYFGLIFILSCVGALVSLVAAFDLVKMKSKKAVYFLTLLLSVACVVIYIVKMITVKNDLKIDLGIFGSIDLSEAIKWSFFYFVGMIVSALTAAASVYGAMKTK